MSDIDQYRDICRKGINALVITPAHKLVLLKLVEYVNDQEDYTAWPSLNTLATDCGVGRMTVVRAIDAACEIGCLKRVHQGGKTRRGGTSNRYRFNVQTVKKDSSNSGSDQKPTQYQRETRSQRDTRYQPGTNPVPSGNGTWSQVGTRSSLSDNLNENLRATPSSSFENDAVVAPEEKKEVAEKEEPSVASSDNLTSEQARTRRRWNTREEFDAEMAAAGLDMSQSRRRWTPRSEQQH
jgi:hypothetical protein